MTHKPYDVKSMFVRRVAVERRKPKTRSRSSISHLSKRAERLNASYSWKAPAAKPQSRATAGSRASRPGELIRWSFRRRRVHLTYTGKPISLTDSNRKGQDGGGGGSRTPVRRVLRLGAYMLISFASCFRRRPSGTGNNEPPTSLESLIPSPQAANPGLSRQSTPRSLMRA